ncbi:MAG: hypothetical protein ACOC9T_00510 [Myxococcota bacterium]
MIGKLLSFVRTEVDDAHVSDVKVDPGGGDNRTAQHFACPGDDSHPLAGDYVATAPSTGRGNEHVTGYIDPSNEPQAGPGEKRIYARDGDGAIVMVVWLKADGTLELGLDPSDAVAVASRVNERLDAIESKLNSLIGTYTGHTHPAPMGATSAPNPPTEDPLDPGQSTASETVKVQP